MKKIKFHNFKNFVILVLVVVAVYQTGMLWLGNNAGHNFFYSFFDKGKETTGKKNIPKVALDPENIVIGYGNKTFGVFYPGISGNEITKETDNFVVQMLEKGQIMAAETVSIENFIENKCVIYNFPIDVMATEYMAGLGLEAVVGIENINTIISIPLWNENNGGRLVFIDEKAGKGVSVVTENPNLGAGLLAEIDKKSEANTQSLRYISTAQSGLNIFKNNTFVPQWTQRQLEYPLVKKESIISGTGKEKEAQVESAVAGFFGGYTGAAVTRDTAGVYMRSNETTVVKYYPEGVLEYYSYEKTEKRAEQSLATAYYVCKEFLKNDITLATEINLSHVQIKSDGLAFYFDYNVNDIPVVLGEKTKEKTNASYGAEVVVENNVVKKYRRYMYDYTQGTDSDFANIDFVGAMNQAASETERGITKVEDMALGYYDVFGENQFGLKWITFLEGMEVVGETKVAVEEATQAQE